MFNVQTEELIFKTIVETWSICLRFSIDDNIIAIGYGYKFDNILLYIIHNS